MTRTADWATIVEKDGKMGSYVKALAAAGILAILGVAYPVSAQVKMVSIKLDLEG